jgi:hypothetical protein
MTFRMQTIAFLLAGIFVFTAATANASETFRGEKVIRYSTGVVTKTGWEKQLVQKEHNLKNFYWMPISSIGQAYKKIPLPARNASNQASNVQPIGSRYKKMNHVALPTNQNIHFDRNVSAKLNSNDVSAKLSSTDTQASLMPKNVEPMRAASYGSYQTTTCTAPSLRTATVRGSLLH